MGLLIGAIKTCSYDGSYIFPLCDRSDIYRSLGQDCALGQRQILRGQIETQQWKSIILLFLLGTATGKINLSHHARGYDKVGQAV